ncbi:MAG: hypothetical protein NDJ72_09490, partial [Elusimicrobia bacterium]|nr:hypothetical protein [Elusimicrobiota bacterium]
MSWNINAIGKPAAVKAVIQNNAQLAPTLKAALCEICDDRPYNGSPHDGIAIEGCGHSGGGSYVHSLKVTRFQHAP